MKLNKTRAKTSITKLLVIIHVRESSSEHLRSSIPNEHVSNKLQVFYYDVFKVKVLTKQKQYFGHLNVSESIDYSTCSLKIWEKEMLTVNIINDMYFYRLNFKYILIKR